MRHLYCFSVCSAIFLTFTSSNPSSAAVVDTHGAERSVVEGAWMGKFLQRDWTFELKKEDNGWSGRYMRSDTSSWHPLSELVISGRSVSFSIESKPKVSFSLEVDTKKPDMSGAVTIDGVAIVPFSAIRKS
jgi:hypothetical protein